MKYLKIKIADKLYQMETGPEAQVGDQVKMFLDVAANPEFDEFVFGIIQHPIKRVGCCEDSTLYTIEYNLENFTLREDDVMSIATISAVDILAASKQDSIANKIVSTGTTLGTSFGTNANDKVGFHGARTVLRASASQIEIPPIILTASNPPTQAEVQAIIDRLDLVVTLSNELRFASVQKGLIKGLA